MCAELILAAASDPPYTVVYVMSGHVQFHEHITCTCTYGPVNKQILITVFSAVITTRTVRAVDLEPVLVWDNYFIAPAKVMNRRRRCSRGLLVLPTSWSCTYTCSMSLNHALELLIHVTLYMYMYTCTCTGHLPVCIEERLKILEYNIQ